MNNNISYDNGMGYMNLSEVITIYSFVKETKLYKLFRDYFLAYFPANYNKLMEEQGLYGRTEFVRSVYQWHKKGKGKQCAIICGYAGSGKTAIIKYFEKMPQVRNRYKVITKLEDIPQKDSVIENTILFFDYAIEMRGKIQQLYRSLDKNQKISLILLERDKTENAFKQGLGEDIEIKVFNINKDALLSDEMLERVINHNYKYKRTEVEGRTMMSLVYSGECPFKLEKYVDIIKKIDPELKRPIFAVFIGEILRENGAFDVEDQDNICKRYWENVKSKEKYKKMERYPKTAISYDMLSDLREISKIPILLASILDVEIIISFADDEIIWKILKDGLEAVEFNKLIEFFEEKFNMFSEIQLNFFLGLEGEKDRIFYHGARTCIVEREKNYDLLIAWLFRNCIQDEKIKKLFLIDALSCFSTNMKKTFLQKSFRYTEDYVATNACILEFLNNCDALYIDWSIEHYLSIIKERIDAYLFEEKNEIKKMNQEIAIMIYEKAKESLDSEDWNVLDKNLKKYMKEKMESEELLQWKDIIDDQNPADSDGLART